jgi:hypothetical protein
MASGSTGWWMRCGGNGNCVAAVVADAELCVRYAGLWNGAVTSLSRAPISVKSIVNTRVNRLLALGVSDRGVSGRRAMGSSACAHVRCVLRRLAALPCARRSGGTEARDLIGPRDGSNQLQIQSTPEPEIGAAGLFLTWLTTTHRPLHWKNPGFTESSFRIRCQLGHPGAKLRPSSFFHKRLRPNPGRF